jgi:hypothetical protein
MNKLALVLCLSLLCFCVFSTLYFKMMNDDLDNPGVSGDLRSEVYAYQGDFEEHYTHALNLDYGTYPPLFSWLAHWFSNSRMSFYFFVSILIFVLVPLLLWFLVKSNWVVFFYFATSLAFRVDYLAIYPQLLISVWLIAFLLVKDWRFRLASLFGVILLHSWGFFLFLGAWVIIEFWEIVLDKLRGFLFKFEGLKSFGCVPLGGGILATVNHTPLFFFDWLPKVKSTITQVGDLFRFFSRDCNLLFVFGALKGCFDKRRLDFVLVGLVLFVVGCFSFRVWYSLFLLVVVGFVWYFEKLSDKWKLPWILLGAAFICLHAFTWFFDKKLLITGGC